MPTEALSDVELDELERSEIPEETREFDVLVPEGW